MSGSRRDNEELEKRLRDHFHEEVEKAKPPPHWWDKALSDLGEQRRARRWFPTPARLLALRPLPALVFVLVIAVSLTGSLLWVFSPWQRGPSHPVPYPGPTGLVIAYSLDLALAVPDLGQAVDHVSRTTESLGGVVVSSLRQGDESANVTVRIPAARFDEANRILYSMAERVLVESYRSQDLTQDYVELRSHLENWQALEQMSLQMLNEADDEKETRRLEEMLSLIRREIEWIKGRVETVVRASNEISITVLLQTTQKP